MTSSLSRSTPLRKKSAKKKRKPRAQCSWSKRCPRIVSVRISDEERYCVVHVKWVAKKIVGDAVKARDGRCVLEDFNDKPCDGPWQWCHLIPQGRYPSLRFMESNAICACLRHHMSFDKSSVERELWCRRNLGERYEALQQMVVDKVSGPTAAEIIEQERVT